ncbi:MAG: guanine deaminase [Spirochaetaceae bacterium]|nr:guanine deaminase [Spirochaetaceae bacterium]
MSAAAAGRVVRGAVLSYRDDPARAGAQHAVRYHQRGAVVLGGDGRIAWCGSAAELPDRFRALAADDYGPALVLPGFIDAHIHFPQYRMLAAPGRDLLDWLQRYTFPEECRYRSTAHACAAAEVFLDRRVRHGTTAAVVFSTVHRAATDALFAAAEARRMAVVTGKTMMDRNAPAELCDDPARGAEDSEVLIDRWHGRGRLRYAITVRFAVTSSEAQLRAAGGLAARHPGCHVHTHLSESQAEIALVARDFPWAQDYTDVYDRFGLVGARSLFAHGIHLSERERACLSAAGATVVHCPTSNTFLGSGLFDLRRLRSGTHPVGVGLATDVGGGTSYSMLATMGEAYKVAMLRGYRPTAHELFHLATRGNAVRLGMDDQVGCLEPGRWADLVVLDPAATPVLADRNELSANLEETLFALAILGDDRAVRATYVAGRPAWLAEPAADPADSCRHPVAKE